MPREKKKSDPPAGAPAYMNTWGDMCTLLLCFFVLLLAMSTIDPTRANALAASFQNAFSGVLEAYPNILITKDVFVPKMGGEQQNKRMAIDAASKMRTKIKEEDMEEMIKVNVTETGIALKISDQAGFGSGSADLKPEMHKVLLELSALVNEAPTSQIRVEGHTDNVPINSARYPSNWDLSAARAMNVVKYMAHSGNVNPSRLSETGHGEYRPIAPNTTAENRSKNRRIEIYVDYIDKKGEPATRSFNEQE